MRPRSRPVRSAVRRTLTAGPGGDDRRRGRGVEPDAGTWQTLVLSSGTAIRVPPPPTGQAAERDLDAVVQADAAPTDETLDAISFWDTGSPGFRWNQIGAQLAIADFVARHVPGDDLPQPRDLRRDDRVLGVEAALPSAAAERAPAEDGDRDAEQPVVPSEHGAAAGAAVGVLGHFYPKQASRAARARAAHAAARVAAGVEHPSDVEAGYALGKAVAAEVATKRIDADGFGAPYPGDADAPYPGGDGSFPILPKDEGFQIMIGEWTPVVVGDVTRFRPPPPPAKASPSGPPSWPR